jgi:prepilin-type N-terminal cleavage/methylation domain-containing protein
MKKTRGFTLLELLVVISIVVFLSGFLIAALWPQKNKALVTATSAMLQTVGSALDQYFSEFHDFPPDGYDTEPGWASSYVSGHTGQPGGTPGINLGGGPTGAHKYTYFGSGCLIYFLCYPVMNMSVIGADNGGFDPRNVRITPCNKGAAFLSTLKKENFSTFFLDPSFDISINPGNSSYGGSIGAQGWASGEIVDAYGFPIHYDKVGDVSNTVLFQAGTFEGGSASYPFPLIHSDSAYMNGVLASQLNPPDDTELNACPSGNHTGTSGPHHSDPRGTAETDGCYLDTPTVHAPVPRNPGGYDLWAHGKCFANAITAITNWK